MPQIFLSYRTTDQAFAAAFFDSELTREFGADAVFFASRSIPLGADWEQAMFDAVSRSEAVLVIIGPGWLTAADSTGRRRLDDPRDFVRREVELALRLGKRVIPVHLERRHPLDDLPEPLRELNEKQSTTVEFRNSKADLARLATRLRQQIPSLRPAPEPPSSHGNVDNSTHNSISGGYFAGPVVQGKQIGGIFFNGGPEETRRG
ncbi:toll/interleukin-1 receptor domain-containing protein [Amycolatopsis sacchari]|uniref:toll/interleukin-1 receptor domain-containing protein n=1 Tax=Amycolatopsis sacchari TaxID=115433 RepID=UPI003D73D6A6